MISGVPNEIIPRSAKPLCLANLAPIVYSILERKQQTTFSEVADIVITKIDENYKDVRTLRRRVYDVLNVLLAAGYIEKDFKTITFTPPVLTQLSTPFSENYKLHKERILSKQRALIDQVKNLLFYKIIIERNKDSNRTNKCVQLPSIFLVFPENGDGQINRSLDGKSLAISSDSPPLLFSPLNLFDALQFPITDQAICLRKYFRIANLEKILYSQIKEEQTQKVQEKNYQHNNIYHQYIPNVMINNY